MPTANTQPIFSSLGDIQWGPTSATTANTAKDGTGTVLNVFTSDATNGGFVQRIRFRSAGTNIATVARVFINNGSANSTPAAARSPPPATAAVGRGGHRAVG